MNSTITPLDLPRPPAVAARDGRAPAVVVIEGAAIGVAAVLDTWQIDDE